MKLRYFSKLMLSMLVMMGASLGGVVASANSAEIQNGEPVALEKNQVNNTTERNPSKKVLGELRERRSANTQHYLLEDGTYKAVISLGSPSYEESMKPTLLASQKQFHRNHTAGATSTINESKGYLLSSNTEYNAKIPYHFSDGYTVEYKGEALTFIPVRTAKTVQSDVYYNEDTIHYSNVWTQTDVSLQLMKYGLKETIILKDHTAPNIFEFEVMGKDEEDGLEVRPAFLIDAKGVYRDVEMEVLELNGAKLLRLIADTTDLQFPVVIDPTVEVAPASGSMYVRQSHFGILYTNDMYIKFGKELSDSHVDSWIKFDLTSIPVGTETTIINAKLKLSLGSTVHSASYYPKRLTQPMGSYSRNTYTEQNSAVLFIDPSESGYTIAESDLTGIVRDWINFGYENHGIPLRHR